MNNFFRMILKYTCVINRIWNKDALYYFGAFKIPLALRYLTINGTDPNVTEIRTGAKTL